jgi:hypothetical protein
MERKLLIERWNSKGTKLYKIKKVGIFLSMARRA